MVNILVIDDNKSICDVLKSLFEEEHNFTVDTVQDPLKGVKSIEEKYYNIVITDLKMPEMNGIEVLRIVRKKSPLTEVVMITAFGTIEEAVESIKIGAADFLVKPFSVKEVEIKILKLLENQNLKRKLLSIEEEIKALYNFEEFIGSSKYMKSVYETISKVARTNVPVLITGDTGTGKEIAARAVHNLSKRNNAPFIKISCAAIPHSLLESELFGYEKGAFTGAYKLNEGKFMAADGGTIFLDEIGEMPTALQTKFLRALQEKEVQRVGSSVPIKVDVRIIAATNRNLKEEIKKGSFRQDLYYRLNVVNIKIKPIRERKEDLAELLEYCLLKYCKKHNKTLKGFDDMAKSLLLSYDWPGNVREIENIIERAVVLSAGGLITESDLPQFFMASNDEFSALGGLEKAGLDKKIQEIEKNLIYEALKKNGFSQVKTAKFLQIKRTTLQYKMKKYGLFKKD